MWLHGAFGRSAVDRLEAEHTGHLIECQYRVSSELKHSEQSRRVLWGLRGASVHSVGRHRGRDRVGTGHLADPSPSAGALRLPLHGPNTHHSNDKKYLPRVVHFRRPASYGSHSYCDKDCYKEE